MANRSDRGLPELPGMPKLPPNMHMSVYKSSGAEDAKKLIEATKDDNPLISGLISAVVDAQAEEMVPAGDKSEHTGMIEGQVLGDLNPDMDIHESALGFVNEINEATKAHFAIEGKQPGVFFTVGLNKEVTVLSPHEDEGAQLIVRMLKKQANEMYYAIGNVAEAWMFRGDVKDPTHTGVLRDLQAGKMKVSDLADDLRRECLIVHFEFRNGESRQWLHPIIRNSDSTAVLGEEETNHDGEFGGRMTGYFKQNETS